MKNLLISISFLILAQISGRTQSTLPTPVWDQDGSTPSVFLIGQNETVYEKLMTDHSTMLLEVCENDMNVAYAKWIDLLNQLESHAQNHAFDINGIKLWLNVFWNEDGSIKHLVYHPKPNSKNVKTEDISSFFTSFIDHYEPNLVTQYKFSHYGSASFPTFPQRVRR